MKRVFTLFLLVVVYTFGFSQWQTTINRETPRRSNVEYKGFYTLDIQSLKTQLSKAKESGPGVAPVIVSIPTLAGKIETFKVYSFPVVAKELADKYQLGSYTGVGVEDPSKFLRFSLAPNDFQSMIIKDGVYEFIEPVGASKTVYGVHAKTKKTGDKPFVCTTEEGTFAQNDINKLFEKGNSFAHNPTDFSKMSDKKYRTLRLALSVTGEYSQFFGGTVAGSLAAMNATLTRCNGVFEKDFALHLNLQNFPNIIYLDAATDPYSPAAQMNQWNNQLQQTLNTNVGAANYDIGHLFGGSGGGGNAGCIGCVCMDANKGSGYTSPGWGAPQGDDFDIDYVAHEMGHQLGGNHTFSHGLEGTGVNMEPGSGSTIMGYAGITGANTDVQPHSDAYFHIASIRQIQTNLNNKTCDVETAIANNPPVIAPLPTYNIPKGTAFVLTASATDAENDPMTYTWEEIDNASQTINKNNLGNTATGASFRSLAPSTNPTRYFPRLSSVLAGVLDNSNNLWESVSKVARTSKFAVTVRDNHPVSTQQQTQTAEQTIIVGNDGPFKVTTTQVLNTTPTSPINWDVVNTTNAPYNVANVKIDYTTDNGATWTVLAASTPNDGSESFDFTAYPGNFNMIVRVSAIGNVFYAVGKVTVGGTANCDLTTPVANVVVNNITPNSAEVTWNAVLGITSYKVEYRKTGTATWTTTTATTNSITLSSLDPLTQYEVQVAVICDGNDGAFSVPAQFSTPTDCYIQGPKNLNVTQITMTSAFVTWSATPGVTSYILRYREVGTANWQVQNVSTTSVTLTNLQENKQYEVQVANICESNIAGSFGSSYIFDTPKLDPCDMSSADGSAEYISKVGFKPFGATSGNGWEMSSTSGSSNYTDYTQDLSRRFHLIAGSTGNEISIEKTWAGTKYNEGVTVWIDFNRNGVFEMSEIVFNSTPSETTPVSGTFTVPENVFYSTDLDKYVIMRVAMKRDGAPVMCQGFGFGEVEDYAVNIHKFQFTVGLNIVDNIYIYPNPVDTMLYITKVSDGAKYSIYNAVGQLVMKGTIKNKQIYVGQLQKGVYVIDIDNTTETAQHKFIKN